MCAHLQLCLAVASILTITTLADISCADDKSPFSTELAVEKLAGDGVWVDPRAEPFFERRDKLRLMVWFDQQLLGDGKAYQRRAKEFRDAKRTELRSAAVKTLKSLSDASFKMALPALKKIEQQEEISAIDQHWIVNGFSCTATAEGLKSLQSVKGVKKIFVAVTGGPVTPNANATPGETFAEPERKAFDSNRYKHPWYSRYLMADRVWREFGVTGKGTLNIVHDFNFVFSDNVSKSLYRNPGETPGNGKDDDGNGLIDDYHGFDFQRRTNNLTRIAVPKNAVSPRNMHGFLCAAIICGAGTDSGQFEFGIAPEGHWAGVIAERQLEAAVEWAVEQGADTYSMSFSMPGLGDYRSHWRKVMEHGSLCGVYFVSGAGNFAQSARVPVQMRTPEDIPDVVFAAAGVQRNFSRTPFSSKGPVEWKTEHYQDGSIQKPEVCAFNFGIPFLRLDGQAISSGASGNSFAGPMFCGSIALMLSADPDLLPWDLKQIITSTATEVGPKGVDDETGHGLINCYRAVKEVLRRKAIREGKDATQFVGRVDGDVLDITALQQKLKQSKVSVVRVQAGGQASQLGLKPDDVIVSYNKVEITKPQDLAQAKAQATRDKLESIKVDVIRAGKILTFEFKPGQLGFVPALVFDDPTFQ